MIFPSTGDGRDGPAHELPIVAAGDGRGGRDGPAPDELPIVAAGDGRDGPAPDELAMVAAADFVPEFQCLV